MNGEPRLIDTVVLVHAYTVSDSKKHLAALALVEKVWGGEQATTTLQNLCEFFFVVTRKVEKPISASAAEAIELVKLHRAPFWDALIAACMLENGIRTIVTENERDFKRLLGITAINPFKERVKR